MRELNDTEIKNVAGGHKGGFGHALVEGISEYARSGDLDAAVATFWAHF